MEDELYAWVTMTQDGKVSLVGMITGDGRDLPLITHQKDHLLKLEWVARGHAANTGQKVWMRKYVAVVDYDPIGVSDG